MGAGGTPGRGNNRRDGFSAVGQGRGRVEDDEDGVGHGRVGQAVSSWTRGWKVWAPLRIQISRKGTS